MSRAVFPEISSVGVGVITPYDFAIDRELWRWAPDSVTLHLTRLPAAAAEVTVEMVTALGDDADLAEATRQLTVVEPQVVVYACTSGSFVGGSAGERRIRETVHSAGAVRATTTSGSLLAAVAEVGAGRVAIATPYTRDLTARLEAFLREDRREVVGVEDLGLTTGIWKLRYDEVAELIRRTDRPEAEAIIVSCTNVPTYDVIAPLERELGKPIISANQATMWYALRAIGIAAVGPGQYLLDSVARPSTPRTAPPTVMNALPLPLLQRTPTTYIEPSDCQQSARESRT